MITSSSMENTDSVALSNTSLIHVELRIAKIRNRIVKFACLDVGLIALLWIIYVVISGPADIKLAFWKQIFLPPYEFWRQSLFDIVVSHLSFFVKVERIGHSNFLDPEFLAFYHVSSHLRLLSRLPLVARGSKFHSF